jgi:hypothetical protein
MPTFATASFLYDAVLAVHGFDAGLPDHVISAANDVTFKALMANQVSTIMNYLDNAAVAVLYHWRCRLMARSRRPHHYFGRDRQRRERNESPHLIFGRQKELRTYKESRNQRSQHRLIL